jgi:hypothetical protein
MFRLLIWNTKKRDLSAAVARLVHVFRIDLVVLVEHGKDMSGSVVRNLNRVDESFRCTLDEPRFGVYLRDSSSGSIRPLPNPTGDSSSRSRFRFVLLEFGQKGSMIVGMIHGFDRRNHPIENGNHRRLFREFRQAAAFHEAIIGHSRSVLLGDFNANPFEESMTSADGLHALNCASVRGETSRRISPGQTETFFSNLSWAQYADLSNERPVAMHWFHRQGANELCWHMVDQIVVRPTVIPWIESDGVQILTRADSINLANKYGEPDGEKYSDHFPVLLIVNPKL